MPITIAGVNNNLLINFTKSSMEDLVKLISRLLLTPAIVIGIGCVFYSKELMEMLYPIHKTDTLEMYADHLNEASKIFSLLMLSFIAISTTYIYGTLLTANGNLRQLNFMAASGMPDAAIKLSCRKLPFAVSKVP